MFTINIKSITKAQKALALLQKHGIRCVIERSLGKGSGCGFTLRVTGSNTNRAEVCALLGSIGVNCDLS